MSDQPQSLRLGEILGLPGVEQIVDHREQAFLGRIPRLREVVIEMRLVDGLDGRVDVRVGREQHATRQRVDLAGSREHLGALHARHPLVADHDGQRVASGLQLADGGERLFARRRADDRVGLPVPRAEIAAHRREHLRIVVDDEEDGLVHGRPPAPSASASGRETRNSVRPGRDSTSISASLWLTRRRTMSRPRPVPFPTGLVVKNGSNRRSRISAGMPGAVVDHAHHDALPLAVRGHLDATGVGNGIEGVVDQVRPDLVELADEAANAREVGLHVHGDGDRLRPRLRLEHGDRVAQARRQVHRLGHRGLVHVRESLDGHDQAGDPHRGFLNLRGDPANRTSGGRPPEDRVERRSARPRRQSDRAPRASRRFRPAVRRWRRRRRDPRASRRWRPRVRPAGSETARRARAWRGRTRAPHRWRRAGRRSASRRPARASPARRPPGGPRAAPRCVRSRRPGCSARGPVQRTASRARPSSRRAGRST